jgi:cell division septation protein DedD
LEISGLSPYLAVQVSADPEDQTTASQETAQAAKSSPTPATSAPDRVELVRTQNLASPPPEQMDIKEAAILLRQVTLQLGGMERQDMRQLYQFDRLRDLCCRLQGAAEA